MNYIFVLMIISLCMFVLSILTLYIVGNTFLIILSLVSSSCNSIGYMVYLYDYLMSCNMDVVLSLIFLLMISSVLPLFNFHFKLFSLVIQCIL